VATTDGLLHGLEVHPGSAAAGRTEVPETMEEAWNLKADGAVTAGPEVVYLGLKHEAYPGYQGVEAVDKSNGKVLWRVDPESSFFTTFFEYHNQWSKPGGDARIYAITKDNRVVSLKEKERDTRVKLTVVPKVEAIPTRIVGKAAKDKDAAAPADAPKEDKK
jgi:hypothetical protein